MKCANCGAAMGCACQKRVASNGKVGCSRCIGSLNKTSTPVKPTNKN